MANALGPLGVSPRAEELYRVYLRLPDASPTELLEHSAYSAGDFEMLTNELINGGLLRSGDDGKVSVIPPTRAIDALVGHEQQAVKERLGQLERARATLSLYATEYKPKGESTPLAEIVPYTEFTESVIGVISETELPINIIYFRLKPELEERLRIIKHAIMPGKKYNILLPSEHVDDQSVIAPMRELIRPGVQIRFAAQTVTSLTVFGDQMASTMVDPMDYYSDRLVIRTSALIEIFQDYFNAIWRIGIPLGRDESESVDEVLLLMAQGLKDEAIAAQLKVSLRTVRRRIAEILDMLGAESRFQAGVEARRRGLI